MIRDADVVEFARPVVVQVAPAAARHEIGDAALRLDPLVQMLVAREDDVDAVAHQRRFERGTNHVAALRGVLPR